MRSVCDRIVGRNIVVQKYYNFVRFILQCVVCVSWKLQDQYANICFSEHLFGRRKSKIARFICKNNVFKILFIKVYHFHPLHYTTTYHYHNSTSPKTNNHNKITPSTTPLYLPTIPPYKTIKPTYPPSTTTHTHQKNLQNKTLHSTKTKNFQN